jgi:membrane protein DedA with SNARE-associated domain
MQPPPPTAPNASPAAGPDPATATPRARRLALASFFTLTGLGVLGSALSPYLLVEHPRVLIALSPDVRHFMLVAANTPFLPVLGVGFVRRVLGLLATYALGASFGPTLIDWLGARSSRTGRFLRWVERIYLRFDVLLLVLWPSYTGGMLAGAAGTAPRRFLPAMAVGQVVYIAASYYLGAAITGWTQPLLRFLGEHLVASTAVCAAAVALHQAWTRWRGRSA